MRLLIGLGVFFQKSPIKVVEATRIEEESNEGLECHPLSLRVKTNNIRKANCQRHLVN